MFLITKCTPLQTVTKAILKMESWVPHRITGVIEALIKSHLWAFSSVAKHLVSGVNHTMGNASNTYVAFVR